MTIKIVFSFLIRNLYRPIWQRQKNWPVSVAGEAEAEGECENLWKNGLNFMNI